MSKTIVFFQIQEKRLALSDASHYITDRRNFSHCTRPVYFETCETVMYLRENCSS